MGSPLIYLDSNIIIRFIQGDATEQETIQRRLSGEQGWVVSQLSRLECRCQPLRTDNRELLGRYDRFFASREVHVTELTSATIDLATQLRATYNFSTPDAIHLAAAIVAGADTFLTADRQLTRCSELTVELL